jgi:lysyl-tRNA synthetase class II
VSSSDRFVARSALIKDITARGSWTPYPANYSVSISIPSLLEKYAHLKPGEALNGDSVSIAGRVSSRRDASSKLVFFDVECGVREENLLAETSLSALDSAAPNTTIAGKNRRIQVMFTHRQYSASNMDTVQNVIRRGDIIGTFQSLMTVPEFLFLRKGVFFSLIFQESRATRAEPKLANSALFRKKSHC